LTLLVGRQEEQIRPIKWATRCSCGYLSAGNCKWFAYDQADAIITPSSL